MLQGSRQGERLIEYMAICRYLVILFQDSTKLLASLYSLCGITLHYTICRISIHARLDQSQKYRLAKKQSERANLKILPYGMNVTYHIVP